MSEQKSVKKKKPKEPKSAQQTYNTLTDTVSGPNVRWKDNLFQGIAVFVTLVLGVGIGAGIALYLDGSVVVGCLVGGLLGLIGGVVVSGLFLMIYRAMKQARGEHD